MSTQNSPRANWCRLRTKSCLQTEENEENRERLNLTHTRTVTVPNNESTDGNRSRLVAKVPTNLLDYSIYVPHMKRLGFFLRIDSRNQQVRALQVAVDRAEQPR